MAKFKNIQFAKGDKKSFADFKKDFASVLKDLSNDEVKQAHKVYNGDSKTSIPKRKKVKKS